MKYGVTKIEYQENKRIVTLEDGKIVTINVCDGDEEACNIGTSDNVGYCLRGKFENDFDEFTGAGTTCNIVWDFGEMEEQPDALDAYDWLLENARTECRLEIWG